MEVNKLSPELHPLYDIEWSPLFRAISV